METEGCLPHQLGIREGDGGEHHGSWRFFCFCFLKRFILFFVYLFLAALGLHCCAWVFFSSCGERGLLFVVVRKLLIAVASLVAEHGL